jgi:hypothetical protein
MRGMLTAYQRYQAGDSSCAVDVKLCDVERRAGHQETSYRWRGARPVSFARWSRVLRAFTLNSPASAAFHQCAAQDLDSAPHHNSIHLDTLADGALSERTCVAGSRAFELGK